MKKNCGKSHHVYLLGLLLLYGLLVSVLNLDYNSVFIDEAFHITMGHQLLDGSPCPGCYHHTGSVMTWPVIAALGDSIGGIYGARGINILIGLALTVVVYLTAKILFNEKSALLAAAIFIFSGQALYLMKLATYDMLAAFFLALAFLLVIASGRVDSSWYECTALLAGSMFLFLASITKYLVPVYVPAFLIYIALKHRFWKFVLFSVAPLALLAILYYCLSPYPPKAEVLGQIEDVRSTTQISLNMLTDWTFRWVSLAYLLAVFGIFHERKGRKALLLTLFSTPIIILHFVTRAEQSVNKNMIFALIFLAPAAALGISHIVTLFSMRSSSRAVRNFFTAAVLVIVWVYGLCNLRWLERQYPDVSPVISYFDKNGFDGMTVAMNGADGVIYEYTLGPKYPKAHFQHISFYIEPGDPDPRLDDKVDFIVCEDQYYGKHYPSGRFRDFLDRDFTLLEDFTIEHSWGETDAKIFGRR